MQYKGSTTIKRRPKDGVPGKDAHSPYIGVNGNWYFWDDATGQFVDSGLSAHGDDGHSPYINTSTNTWYEWDSSTGSYKDTGIKAKGVDGDGITGSTIDYVIADSGVTIPSTGWSTNVPIPVKGKYLWARTTTTFKVLPTKVSYSVSYYGTDGTNGVGTDGLPGQIPFKKEWIQGDTHRYNDSIIDYIYVRGANKDQSYWYKRASKGDVTAGVPPTGGTTPTGYERVDWLNNLAVNVLIAEETNIANFIFKDGVFWSLKGTVDGVEADYTGQTNFIPNVVIDGKTGKITANNADIRGTIRGVGGYFEGMVRAPFKTHSADFEYFGDENGFHPISTPNNATSQNIIVSPQQFAYTLNLPTSDFNGLKLTIINMSTVFGSSLNNYGKYVINAGTNKIMNANYGYWMETVDQWNDMAATIDVVVDNTSPMVNTPVSIIELDRGEMIELIGVEGLTSLAPNYITKGWIITNRRQVLPIQ